MRVVCKHTVRVEQLLRSRNDDDTEPLKIEQTEDGYLVTRSDGSEPSEAEAVHIRATVAAVG